jgi:hypothetical protein
VLEYQKNNCGLIMSEGLKCYYDSLPESKEVFKDNPESGNLLRDHDCTHIIFGLDISIDQEAILDTWVLWGSSFKWKYLLGYSKLPQINELQKNLFKELGIKGFLKLYWNTIAIKRKVIFRTFKMKKKWPFQMPEEYLDMKISDLREIHGIKVLSSEELNYFPTQWSGSINK